MIGRWAFLSDIHFPYEDSRAWALTCGLLPHLDLTGVILGGDIVDFEPISKFVEHPQRKLDLKPQLLDARKQLLRFRKVVGDKPVIYLQGNHEYRMERYIYQRAPELAGIDALTVPELIKLNKDDLDIQWKDRTVVLTLGHLHVSHGDQIKAGGLSPARSIYQKVGCNMLVGHHHKFDRYMHRLYGSSLHGTWVNGTLASLNPDWTFFPQWHSGFTVVEASKSGLFYVEQIPFFQRGSKLCAWIHGKEYSGMTLPKLPKRLMEEEDAGFEDEETTEPVELSDAPHTPPKRRVRRGASKKQLKKVKK